MSGASSETTPRLGAVELDDVPRISAVELEGVHLIEPPRLDESENFQNMLHRLEAGEQVVDSLRQRGQLRLDVLLTAELDRLVNQCGLTGMMIASDDGFPIAQSSAMAQSETLAAIGCLFHLTVRRTQAEGVVEKVEEMTLRGFSGEQVVVRFFTGLDQRYFLVAYAKQPCSHRRATARALKYCGDLLRLSAGETAAQKRRTRREKISAHNPAAPPGEASLAAAS